jgi:hypothetical protein
MLGVYPLKPVITEDPQWKSVYDDHPDSVNLTSACLTAGEASKLLDAGAVFEAVVLLNDAGEQLIERIAPSEAAHPEELPRVERLRLEERSLDALARIHDYLRDGPQVFFQAAGG